MAQIRRTAVEAMARHLRTQRAARTGERSVPLISGDNPIRNFMTPMPIGIDADLTLADAKDRMASEKVRHLPVKDGDRLIGILTARDIILMEALPGIVPHETPVGPAMNGDVKSCGPDVSVKEVLAMMENGHVGAIPILEDGEVVGIFTDVDAVRILRNALV